MSRGLTFLLSLAFANIALATTPCNCSKRLGSCLATPVFLDGKPMIKTDTIQCSYVTYTINGNPASTTVIDRLSGVSWLGSGMPSLQIDSCEVCSDKRFPEGSSSTASPSDSYLRQRLEEQARQIERNNRIIERQERELEMLESQNN